MNTLPFPIVEDFTTRELEAGRKLFAGPVDFLKGVVAIDGLPPDDRREVCFAGRSNVGKSSLINALTGRKALARTSSTPGRTQEINYFTLGEERYLVDLPGYGEIMALLNSSAVTFQVVLTKADKPSKSDLDKNLAQVREALQSSPAAFPELVITSSEKGEGIDKLRAIITAID